MLGDNFSATCDVLKYDTLRNNSSWNQLFQARIRSTGRNSRAQPDVTEARKIMYNRATGEFQAMESRGANIIN